MTDILTIETAAAEQGFMSESRVLINGEYIGTLIFINEEAVAAFADAMDRLFRASKILTSLTEQGYIEALTAVSNLIKSEQAPTSATPPESPA